MAATGRPGANEEAVFRREIVSWALIGLTLGLVEGATAAVLVKTGYRGTTSPLAVNLATALVSGAPAFSNVVSFVWANIAHGRSRVRLLVRLQALFALLVGFIGLAPRAGGGLVFAVVSILAARMVWAGILTVRAAVWTANYPRQVIARVTGRIVIVSSLAVAGAAALAGGVLAARAFDPRWLYGGAAACGLLAASLYRRVRVRREFRLLAQESAEGGSSEAFSLRMVREILAQDPSFREYMLWMGLFGGGNLMLIAQLVVVLTDGFGMPGGRQILLLAVVPLLALPVFVPWWARRFDGEHVVVYRARQGWALVAAVTMFSAAVLAGWSWLLWCGAVTYGFAMAGANLGWNLGHADFASSGRAQHYMGVHVTLTGVRGMLAPPLGMLAYQLLEDWQRGLGRYALVLPLAMTTAGTLGFNRMKNRQT
ncbi:MAG: MFS transporter [Steroidobacteraceae bacterium]